MPYATFVALFLGLPLVGLVVLLRGRLLDPRYLASAGALAALALLFMAPWDHIAASHHLWTWAPAQTWAWRVWGIPLEEYAFCLLQAALTGTLVFALLLRRTRAVSDSADGVANHAGDTKQRG